VADVAGRALPNYNRPHPTRTDAMNVNKYPDRAARRGVATFYDEFPDVEIRYGELDVFKSSSMREPGLQSSYSGKRGDGKACFDVLTLYRKGQLLAALSYFVDTNPRRKTSDNLFARIDVVVTEKDYRGMGVGKLLVITALKYVMQRWGVHLYSISCLAAHDAMARILDSVGFASEQRPNENYVRQTLSFTEVDRAEFAARIDRALAETIQRVRYKFRQDS
jgi:GNAT superfamily N-acetyltransferase